ncbi:hypothetical protein LAC81_15165 [Ensifer adhaerens]|uniref:carph-isopro domain-containing protein n=1 Tax=Ensifer adhaerens TaxID=106592 RepID=UPI001CC1B334|nr:hypothetical protein [Ensifer adhaerens]MBZ7923130.1 hypothetical protein [Ensifer adhaerens]UAX91718.1 hypothetical protein LAC78_15160 [Ensifer adhaerens]UAX99346.1 hypothetical protein LAC80_15165 [Ensifer adhaerens]UAY06729.1 hypothetical protein LAC81_15165 [Ensifer adhaerens]
MSTISIRQIIKDAGGAEVIASTIVRLGGDISKDAVYKWTKTGIPDRHWPVIIALTEHGPAELYEANCAARSVPTELILNLIEAAE